MSQLFIYIKHFLIVTGILLLLGLAVIISQKGTVGFSKSELAFKVGNEGPHLFHRDGQIDVMYIRGSREPGFEVETTSYPDNQIIEANVYFPLDDSRFTVSIEGNYTTPPAQYDDGNPIIAISDLEGNYAAFRDFLIANKVIDSHLNWQFGKGHLVLVGDMVDRGFSTTQLLWLIYKLEQEATLAGGFVHYIIGNHEIKNLQGNFHSAADKYLAIAGIMGKQQFQLFDQDSVIGRWLESKNTMEIINGYLFTHGGLHPKIPELAISLEEINSIIRSHYRSFYVPRKDFPEQEDLLISNKTGPAWYRGYFKDDIAQQQITESLKTMNAKAIVVGHTLQFRVNRQFENKVIAIDVKHPDDYNASFPPKRSEGLLIENGKKYRLLDDGERVEI